MLLAAPYINFDGVPGNNSPPRIISEIRKPNPNLNKEQIRPRISADSDSEDTYEIDDVLNSLEETGDEQNSKDSGHTKPATSRRAIQQKIYM
ncbi:hypothetical protein FQA39_LY01374 [Lamprigera yunnana]|nr:hypothetical protein FQA39_LY01374 [Lamprigera yunnana]